MGKKIWGIIIMGTILGMCAHLGYAQEKAYPNRQIEVIIPYDPGGSIDMMARIYIGAVKDVLKVPMVAVNKPGAGGTIGTTYVANAKQDGYTIGASSIGPLIIVPNVETKLPYKWSEMTMVCKTMNFPVGIFVRADAPWKNLKELIDYAKENPGKLRAAIGGPVGLNAFVLEAFKIQAGGLNIISIPGKGGAAMATALIGGHVELASDPVASEINLLRAGRVRVLAISDKFPGFPQLPTFEEAGLPGVNLSAWAAIIAPQGLPRSIRDRLSAAFEQAAKDKKVIDRLHREVMSADFMKSEAFVKQVTRDEVMMQDLVRKVGLRK